MNTVKYVRVQQSDGSYTQNVPIGAQAQNVILQDGTNVQNKLGTFNNTLNTINNRFNQITTLVDGSTTGDAELIDIRNDAFGTTHASAGTSVREQAKKITRAEAFLNDQQILQIHNYKLVDDTQDNYDISQAIQNWMTGHPQVVNQIGTPLKASTAAAMTDTSRIYVYTGNQSGYINGNWYYYNNGTWVSGGVYNSVAVETDTTLSVTGSPADAKVVGDEFIDIKNVINSFYSSNSNNSIIWGRGGLSSSTGGTSNANANKRCRMAEVMIDGQTVICDGSVRFYVYFYNGPFSSATYVGNSGAWLHGCDITDYASKHYPTADRFKLVGSMSDDSDIGDGSSADVTECTSHIFILEKYGTEADVNSKYGFVKLLTSNDDLANINECGAYRWSSESVPANSPTSVGGVLFVYGAVTKSFEAKAGLIISYVGDLFTNVSSSSGWLSDWAFHKAIELDNTLSISGDAADAKVTGDKINEIEERLSSSEDTIANIANVEEIVITPVFTNATGINSYGKTFNSSKRIATVSYLNVKSIDTVLYDVDDGYRIYGAFYVNKDDTSKISTFGWLTGNGEITKPSTAEYLRVCLASVEDESTVTTDDANKVQLFSSYKLMTDVKFALSAIESSAADARVVEDKINKLGNQLLSNEDTIANIANVEEIVITPVFTNATCINSQGNTFDSPKRIATVNYLNVKLLNAISYDVDDGYRIYGAFYTDEDYTSKISTFGWLTGNGEIVKPDTAKYLRVCLASIEDESVVTVDDANKVRLFSTYKLMTDVNFTLSAINGTEVLFNFVSSVTKTATAPMNSIDAQFKCGLYNIPSGSSNIPEDAPDGFSGGSLLIVPCFSKITNTGYPLNQRQKMGILIDPLTKKAWIRYANSQNEWQSWFVVDMTVSSDEINAIIKSMDSTMALLSSGDKNVIDYDSITANKRILAETGAISDAGSTSISDYIPIRYGISIVLSFRLSSGIYGMAFYDALKNFISGSVQGSSQTIFQAPENSAFVRITIPNAELIPESETASAYITTDAIMSLSEEVQEAKEYTPIVKKTKWLAVGDSITCGVYSVEGGSNVHAVTNEGWVPKLANALGYELTKMASCGMGYTARITGRLPETPAASSPRISMDELLTRIEALTDDFNLVTVAFGTNDYGTITGVTLDTIKTGCMDCLERITTKFPKARVVCITPFNMYGHKVDDVVTPYGTKNGTEESGVEKENWQDAGKFAFGYTYGAKKLRQVADAIKECCEELGVECIYATDGFIFNSNNIASLLFDGVHPSLDAHDLIAKGMAHYLFD